jgi:hypothetical protein
MTSLVEDHEVDARWREVLGGFDARVGTRDVGARVEHRARQRRARRLTRSFTSGAVAVLLVVAGVGLLGQGGDGRVDTAAARGRVVPGNAAAQGASELRIVVGTSNVTDESAAASPTDRTPEIFVTGTVAGPRVLVSMQAAYDLASGVDELPTAWRISVDGVPGSERTIPVGDDGPVTYLAELGQGEYTVRAVGSDPHGHELRVNGSFRVVPEYSEPAGPATATLDVTSGPTLRMSATPVSVPVGEVVEIRFRSEGGGHALTIDQIPGLALHAGDHETVTAKVRFDRPGRYVLSCAIPGHLEAGEQVAIEAVAPDDGAASGKL